MKNDPFDTHFADEIIKLKVATVRIRGARMFGHASLIPELNQAGLKDESAFWELALSYAQTIREFVEIISPFHARPDQQDAEAFAARHVGDAISRARAANESFFKSPTHFDPRGALEWMMSVPVYRRLVPESARRFLSPDNVADVAVQPPTALVAVAKIREYLMGFSPKEKSRGVLFDEASRHFGSGLRERNFDLAYKGLPPTHRREKGETDKTLKRRGR